MPHEKFLSRAAKTEIPFLGLSLLGNAYPASYAGQKQRFFSAGFGWLNLNKPLRKTPFGIIWCNSKKKHQILLSHHLRFVLELTFVTLHHENTSAKWCNWSALKIPFTKIS